MGFLGWFLLGTQSLGLQLAIYSCVVSIGIIGLAKDYDRKVPATTYLFSSLSILLFGLVAVRSSQLLVGLNIFIGLWLLCLAAKSLAHDNIKKLNLIDYFAVLLQPIYSLPGLGRFMLAAGKALTGISARIKIRPEIIKGLLISAPLLLIFGSLFAAADSTFSNLFKDIRVNFNADFEPVIVTFLLASFLLGMILHVYRPSPEINYKKIDKQLIGKTEVNIVLSVLVGLFTVFCLTQLAVIFGTTDTSDAQLAHEARKGFAQLTFAAGLVFVTLNIFDKQLSLGKIQKSTKALSASLVGLTAIILASAFKRLLSYEQEFGYTLTRLFVHGFMILIMVWLIAQAWKIIKNTPVNIFTQILVGSIVLFTLSLNMINPDLLVAKHNLSRNSGRSVDYYYLSNLSTDANSALVGVLNDDQIDDSQYQAVKNKLCRNLNDKDHTDIRTWNYSKYKATKLDINCP